MVLIETPVFTHENIKVLVVSSFQVIEANVRMVKLNVATDFYFCQSQFSYIRDHFSHVCQSL